MTEEELFSEALIRPAGDRMVWLATACAGDDVLRGRIAALLAAYDPADGFLETPAGFDRPTATYSPGEQIGPYRLVRLIGEGGMGIVFLAEQESPVRRQVALKIIKPGLDSDRVVARFSAERQALALMSHPNIAQVLDVGATKTGRPYFAMELISGLPITKFCDREKLTPRERIELFIPVCRAIQHAHQKGIIHRDLKPSNILVTDVDGRPVPMVIDFGVAKATHDRLTDRSLHTEFGQVIGTLEYMSPEQADRPGLDIDTRSDIYSLGVVLYELITGTTPLDRTQLRETGFLEMLRIIREEEPAKPSTRLSQSGDALPAISERRRTESSKLPRLIRGELDWIVMKCLDKDRSRRYETANGLARDLERYLSDEAVEACPPNARDRLRKFVRRNKGTVTAAGAVVLTLVAGIVGTTWGLLEALSQKREAQSQAATAEAVNEFLRVDLLEQADVDNQPGGAEGRHPDIKVRTLLDRAARGMEKRFANQPLTEAGLRMTLATAYRQLGLPGEARPHADRAVPLYCQHRGENHPDTRKARLLQAALSYDLGQFDDCAVKCRELLAAGDSRPKPEDTLPLHARNYLALVERARGRYLAATAIYEELLLDAGASLGQEHRDTVAVVHGLAAVCLLQGQTERALSLFEGAVNWRTEHLGRSHRDTMNSLHGLASTCAGLNQHERAKALFEELIETARQLRPDHPNLTNYQRGLALAHFRHGAFDLAEDVYRDVLQSQMTRLGPQHPQTLSTRNSLAATLDRLGRSAECDELLRGILDEYRRQLGLAHPDTQKVICNRIACLERLGQHDQAIPLCRELTEFWRQCADAIPPSHVAQLADVGQNLLRESKWVEAETVLRAALAMGEKQEPSGWQTARAQALLGKSLLHQGQTEGAEPVLIAAHGRLVALKSPHAAAEVRSELQQIIARMYADQGRMAESTKWQSLVP